jgi:hypothetical protein
LRRTTATMMGIAMMSGADVDATRGLIEARPPFPRLFPPSAAGGKAALRARRHRVESLDVHRSAHEDISGLRSGVCNARLGT